MDLSPRAKRHSVRNLWREINIVSVLQPWVTSGSGLHRVRSWQSLLPIPIPWPINHQRVEDGAGTASTASWTRPTGTDVFQDLRRQWVNRFFSSDLHRKITAALLSGSKEPPLSGDELAPFLADVRAFLKLDDDRLWQSCLTVAPGQPFRLALWRSLMGAFSDPGAPFLDSLKDGVPWVWTHLRPCHRVR